MLKIEPATLHRIDDPRLVSLVRNLVGERILRVRYSVPAGVIWQGDTELDHVHEVDMGVELVTDSGLVLELSWATPGSREGLAFTLDRLEELRPNKLVDLVEVSGRREWSRIVGYPVDKIGVSFHVYSYDSSVRPWSFRIEMSNGCSLVVALGEIDGRILSYMPNNIVVMLDEDVAGEYYVPDSLQSAWGETVRS
ncbi:hypothetical protein ABZ863_09155 [Saccharomonospora sp. NPDC046836]|uniref:hypothetical protein n=1 Tax=Saccharomonospora sp. NPDC046836 TaxID=3156921 RepID=UPI0033F1010F